MAGVVGFVLILAAAITYFAFVQQSQVPRWGAENERAWDAALGEGFTALGRDASAGVGADTPVTELLPPPPQGGGWDIPLVAKTKPAIPSGTVAFLPDCGGVTATHRIGGADVVDLADGARGCLLFTSHPVYGQGYGYRLENGGLLREQDDGQLVVAGPSLAIREEGGIHLVSMTLYELRGAATTVASQDAGISMVLHPTAGTTEDVAGANAEEVSWTLRSAAPEAWKAWFTGQLDAAGLDASTNYACVAADATSCPGLAADEVRIVIKGADPAARDVSLALSYEVYDVTLR